jgi:hypothetical protein
LKNDVAHAPCRDSSRHLCWPSGWVKTNLLLAVAVLPCGCSRAQTKAEPEPTPAVRIDLSALGLPKGFFQPDAETKCAGQIIGYRFVVWLNNEDVAVGFNTSPNCRVVPDRTVDGSARVLVFNGSGALKAKRDIPYLADGNGEIVADGEAKSGPSGTLLFRIGSVNVDKEGRNQSKSGVLLLDANLLDVARFDRLLEQTTFVDHALVFQEGFTSGRLRTYEVLDGSPPSLIKQWKQDWPVDARGRKFGEHGLAYMTCQQELRPNEYVSTAVVYLGARQRCTMNAESEDRRFWQAPLRDGDTAEILGLLTDGSVVGHVSGRESKAGQLVIWKKDYTVDVLPWIPKDFCGPVPSATADMSRYAAFATCDDRRDDGRWFVFDRRSQAPLVNRPFPKNGRADLSPDGSRYASFESGELRLYSLPKPQ